MWRAAGEIAGLMLEDAPEHVLKPVRPM